MQRPKIKESAKYEYGSVICDDPKGVLKRAADKAKGLILLEEGHYEDGTGYTIMEVRVD